MKQKDIMLILVIVFISALFALVISKVVFTKPSKRAQQVEVVQPISASFAEPDKAYFNSDAIDPTQPITIGQNDNPNPFNSSSTGQ